MKRSSFLLTVPFILLICLAAAAQAPAPGKNSVLVRGERQDVYYYPATGPSQGRGVLIAPGDGGWHGFALLLAQTVASWGYDVYGLDTRRYLESFTGKTTLGESDVPGDFAEIAKWTGRRTGARLTLIGWSEGAGLALLAASSAGNRTAFNGLVTMGLPDTAVLGWKLADDLTYITKKDPNEPTFKTAPYMRKVAPLPLLMIQSSHDEYVPVEMAKSLFSSASEPKQFQIVTADNHRFDGNRDAFFKTLREGLKWIEAESARP